MGGGGGAETKGQDGKRRSVGGGKPGEIMRIGKLICLRPTTN